MNVFMRACYLRMNNYTFDRYTCMPHKRTLAHTHLCDTNTHTHTHLINDTQSVISF